MTATLFQQINGNIAVPTGTPLQKKRRHWTAGLCISAFLGAVFGLGGISIIGLSLTGLVEHATGLTALGTLLIAGSFPAFFFAGHCLDRADAADKAMRLEYCRLHGLEDKDY